MALPNIRALAAAFALAVWSSPALALLPAKPVEKTCPFSGEKVEAFGFGSMLVTGGTFDMQPVMMGTIIVGPSPVAACADGFLFYKDDFTPVELQKLKSLIFSDEFRALAKQSDHYRAAWLIEEMGGKLSDAISELLAASWEAKAPEDYARFANAALERLPAAIVAETEPPKKEGLMLLKGELLRRLGRFGEAQTYLDGLENEFTDGTQSGVIAKLELRLVAARGHQAAPYSARGIGRCPKLAPVADRSTAGACGQVPLQHRRSIQDKECPGVFLGFCEPIPSCRSRQWRSVAQDCRNPLYRRRSLSRERSHPRPYEPARVIAERPRAGIGGSAS